jgi:phage/plasmid-like protein (TIGR03299 family)
MAHMIYKEKFLSYRQPAWHGLGQVITEEIGAVEAAQRIQLPEIITEPVLTVSGLGTDYKAIIGKLLEGSTVYSVVSNNYCEIIHLDFLKAWDHCVKQNVETIGLLMHGAGLFVSAKLPSFDVMGDEISAYILAENWLTGTRSTKVRKTPVRVVCMNTLQMSDSQSVEELRICHTQPAIDQLERSLTDLIERSTSQYRALKEVYEILASTKVTDVSAKELLVKVYPDKPVPKHLLAQAATNNDALDELAAWERSNGAQVEHRNQTFGLFAGAGRGAMSQAANGTAWGVYNAAAEYEQYLKKARRAESMMFGAGKDRVADAFNEVCSFAGINLESE